MKQFAYMTVSPFAIALDTKNIHPKNNNSIESGL